MFLGNALQTKLLIEIFFAGNLLLVGRMGWNFFINLQLIYIAGREQKSPPPTQILSTFFMSSEKLGNQTLKL